MHTPFFAQRASCPRILAWIEPQTFWLVDDLLYLLLYLHSHTKCACNYYSGTAMCMLCMHEQNSSWMYVRLSLTYGVSHSLVRAEIFENQPAPVPCQPIGAFLIPLRTVHQYLDWTVLFRSNHLNWMKFRIHIPKLMNLFSTFLLLIYLRVWVQLYCINFQVWPCDRFLIYIHFYEQGATVKRFVVLIRTLGTYNSILLVSWLPVLVGIICTTWFSKLTSLIN